MKKAELLAPVGKMENAIAAIENGADALFVGGKGFNARQAADNFTTDELQDIVNYAKLRGVRVYVTVNILVKQKEMKELFDYLTYLEEVGVHAIIIQDLGIAHMVKRYFPQLRMHASTQMAAHSIEDVLFLKSLGFKRVVLARELQLQEIQEIIKTCDIEVETFVHGALCYSYSGQCLMSSLIGGRSGNRGRCAQPCRMKYTLKEDGNALTKESYLLSLKDICSVEFLPQLLEAGIHSFKIEGRMKSPEYVASVVGTYRKYMDLALRNEVYEVTEADMEIMKGVFNRGGFSKGYYYNRGNAKMLTPNSPRHIGLKAGKVTYFAPKTGMATISLERDLHPGDGLEIIRKGKESVGTGITKDCSAGSQIKCHFDYYVEPGSEVYLTKNHQLLKQLKATYQRPQKKLPIHLSIIGHIGEPLEVNLNCENHRVVYKGDVLQIAENNPVTKEQALKQLTKLGSTSFFVEEVSIQWPEDAYIGISQLNHIRREGINQLEAALLSHEVNHPYKAYEEISRKAAIVPIAICHVTSLEQLEACLQVEEVTAIYWEWHYDDVTSRIALERCKAYGKAFYLNLPAIMKDTSHKAYNQVIKAWAESDIEGYVVRNMGEYEVVNGLGKAVIIDYNMNVANNETIALWQERGATRVTVSVELVGEELDGLIGDKEKIVYGTLPMMTSAQCVLRGTPQCQKGVKEKHLFEIEDRKQTSWRIQTDCKACYMQILSYEPLVIKNSEVQRLKQSFSIRLQFTNETVEETKAVLAAYFGTGTKEPLKGTGFKTVL